MPEFRKSLVVQAKPEVVWGAITDFPSYGQFITELRGADVEREGDGEATVLFTIVLPIREVTYRLQYTLTPSSRLAWTMVDSNTLTGNEGEWQLDSEGEGTRIAYRHKIGFPMWMAWAVSDADFTKEMDKTLTKFKTFVEGRS
jgi:ribosome-associated toxin RatA of RatAB toxin-antitoxin module